MSIPVLPRIVDLANLLIAKGANFLLTTTLFALLARGMDGQAFAEFGYWWSIALMIGGILLGGLSSSLIRVAATQHTLHHLGRPLRSAGVGLLMLAALLGLAAWALPGWRGQIALLSALGLFGLAVQAQTTIVALLRAAEATRANLIASLLILLLVPAALHMMVGSNRGLTAVFLGLAAAFALGTVAALAMAHRPIGHLFSHRVEAAQGLSGFLASVASFTTVNVFSYAIVNADFTLFRLIGTSEDFAVMSTGKIFFERFVLPVLLVLAGAISLRVLRFPQMDGAARPKLEARLSPLLLAGMLAVVAVLALGYWFFATVIRGDAAALPLAWALCAAAGYLLYAANGVLFDVLVVRRTLPIVIGHVAGFLLLGTLVQAAAIRSFGLPGWAGGWLLFNAVVAVVLAREGLQLRLAGWGRLGAIQ